MKLGLCRRGTWDAELLDEMKAAKQDRDEVVVKHRSSAFFQTTLGRAADAGGAGAGGVRDHHEFCVDSTIRDAYARDFDVVVPAECVADSDDAAQVATLACIDRFHGVVTNLTELAEALSA